MKTLIPELVKELAANRSAVLVTVLKNKGSAPRGAGACMLVREDGVCLGTIGGGLLEHQAQVEGADMLGTTDSRIAEYSLTQDQILSLGMVCGGNVLLCYQAFDESSLPLWSAMQGMLDSGRSMWLLRHIENGVVTGIDGFTDVRGCSLADEKTLAAYRQRKPVLTEQGNDSWFCEPVRLCTHTYIFGGGHVAQALAPLLSQLDFAPVVYDDRPEFANKECFPTADVICAPFDDMLRRVTITAQDEIVIMTRGHANDQVILLQTMRTPAYYLGLIGSRSKIAHTKGVVLEGGFTEADFERVHTPIGLPIEAETPIEIAVSIAAEMIRCRAESAQ